MIVSATPVFSFVSSPSANAADFSSAPVSVEQQSAKHTQPKRGRRWRRLYSFALLMVALASLIVHYNVDKTLTNEDRHYIHLLMPGLVEGCAVTMPYEAQIALIQRVQKALLARAPLKSGIAEDTPREIKQVYLQRKGLCYDRSRALEKILIYTGLETRHVSVFQREPDVHPLKTVLFHHVPSHAISEIHTTRGWMIVDSNDLWLGLDVMNNPLSMIQLSKHHSNNQPIKWSKMIPPDDINFYNSSPIYIYGLYSRHGRFYPPYTQYIPDYRIRGLFYNFEWTTN